MESNQPIPSNPTQDNTMSTKTTEIISILNSITGGHLYRNGRMGRAIEAIAAAEGPEAAEQEAIDRLNNVTVGLLLTNKAALQWLTDNA